MTDTGNGDQSLNRSLEEIFTEALEAGADCITFTSGPAQIQTVVLKNKVELRKFELNPLFLKPLCKWFYDHYATLWPQDPKPSETEATWKFKAAVRLKRQVMTFNLSRILRLNGSMQISLSDLKTIPIIQALDNFGLGTDERESFLEIIDTARGIFILSSPTNEGLKLSLGAVICLAGFNELNIITDMQAVPELPAEKLNLIYLRADDPIDGILRVKAAGANFERIALLGSICHGLVKRICSSCAREAAIDPSVVSQLPPVLRNKLYGAFRIGRGCEKCGHSGYEGYVGIRSFVRGDAALGEALRANSTHSDLIDLAYDQGAISLFEDGLEKVNEGITSLEALYQCVKVLPEVYLKHLHQDAARKTTNEKPLNLPDDFFVSGDARGERPLAGNHALLRNPEPISLPLDEPVLDLSEKRPRDKHLLLIAEDDADQRSILEMLFKGAGYEVAVASDGLEAFQKIEQMEPDIIVSDLMMPRMDGGQLIRKIRASERFGRLPVLMLTVVSDVQKEYELLDLGADDYCEKTIQRKILLKRVENLLKRV